MRLKSVVCSKGMNTIQTINIPLFFDVISLNNAHKFFTAR